MCLCRVDRNVDEEERSRSVGVWDSRFMRAEVEVVCCRRWKGGCAWEVEGQGRVSCYLKFGFHSCLFLCVCFVELRGKEGGLRFCDETFWTLSAELRLAEILKAGDWLG